MMEIEYIVLQAGTVNICFPGAASGQFDGAASVLTHTHISIDSSPPEYSR